MQVLIDTDVFCKLAVGGLIDDSLGLIGAVLSTCGRLPALPYMLRRGSLRARYGSDTCDALIPIASRMSVVELTADLYVDRLTHIPEIGPGEALLLAAAAKSGIHVITGDKRSLRALKSITGLVEALAGRIITFESILLALCDHLGTEVVRQRARVLRGSDNIVRICFSELNIDPVDCLLSYFSSLTEEVRPLSLWHPRLDGSG